MDPKSIVASGYNQIAATYETWAGRVRTEERARYTQVLLDAVPQGAKVLDLGCGGGALTTQQLAAHFELTGVDISEVHVEAARRRLPQATFVLADMTTLTFPPCSFEAVAAFYSIIHVPREEQPRLLSAISTWLSPGGLFVATLGAWSTAAEYEENWLGAPMYWSSYDTATNRLLVEAAGLQVMQAHEEVAKEDHEFVTFLWVTARKPE